MGEPISFRGRFAIDQARSERQSAQKAAGTMGKSRYRDWRYLTA